jgi:uncharacterized protein (TIGR03000 family)
MYGVVLMAALATSSSAPDFGHCGYGYRGGHGGGSGGYYGGCYGGYGYGYCNGSYGNWGMCAGYGGAMGWCTGYGGAYAGCYGAWWGASASSPYSVGYGCTGCYGCYGGHSGYGVPFPGGTTYISPGMTNPVPPSGIAPGSSPPEVTPLPKLKDKEEQTRAKVRIELPADAQLYVDGTLMKTESAVRMFHTPALAPNQQYFYDLKAVIVRGGQTFTDTQQIVVRPGSLTTASFTGLEQRATTAVQSTQSTAQR